MLKASNTNLKKLENLLQEAGYQIIYEKGQFTAGYCIVNERNMIVINKFYKTEARFNCLLQILNEVSLSEDQLSEANLTLYQQLVPAY